MNSLNHCKSPCNNCPFRKDSLQGWLGEIRIKDILNNNSFVCHKTQNNFKQCAGFMIIKKNESTFVKAAELFKIDLELKNEDLIFDTKEDCIIHHTEIV